MRRTREHQEGLGLLEVLIAGTILLFVMLGMNAALVSSSLVNLRNKDITMATSLAQQLIEGEKARCTDVSYYASLPALSKASLFATMGATDPLMARYMWSRQASPQSLLTDRDTNPGNNVVVKLNGPPIANGIMAGSRVVLYYAPTGTRQTIYVLNPNDAANQFLVDDTSPQRGRQGLQNVFPAGTMVLTASKLLTVQVRYAAVSGSDVAAAAKRPLITLSSYVNNPVL
jgi:Tfp pilus assembly protein PilV